MCAFHKLFLRLFLSTVGYGLNEAIEKNKNKMKMEKKWIQVVGDDTES